MNDALSGDSDRMAQAPKVRALIGAPEQKPQTCSQTSYRAYLQQAVVPLDLVGPAAVC